MLAFLRRLSKVQKIILTVLSGVLILVGIVLVIPSLRESAAYRWEQLTGRIYFMIAPPEKSVFIPEQQLATAVEKTMEGLTPASPTATALPSPMPEITLTPTLTPTALPDQVLIDSVPYYDQHYAFNDCAPANLAMQLGFWGWEGKRETIRPVVKPFDKDKNVMPYEMADYVNENTAFKAVVRQGGTVTLLKALVTNGFPVMVEKGVMFRDTTGRVSWMGHYNIVLGYDEAQQQLITHDSFLDDGKFKRFSYEQLKQEWQAFNYVFMVVYPPEQWDKLAGVLGAYADESQSYSLALDISASEIPVTSDAAHFFAVFNRGTNLVKLQDYAGAAAAYDEAYNYYATLPEQNRPYRITWYQTGPYFAYYYMARYQDVIQLANTTLDTTPEPYLEESYYWRALAEVMVGQHDDAVADLCTSLKYHPDFSPSVSELGSLGVSACP